MAGGVTVGLIVATPDKAQVDVASMPRDRAAPGVEYSMVF
jgi:hypothetical protein